MGLIQTTAGTTKLAAQPRLCAVAIACSSALLFVVQPVMAKALLPRFGGAAGVWVACMLFFQVVLLLGYLYSFCVTRYCSPRAQALIHLAVLGLSLSALPLGARAESIGGNPTLAILLQLGASVGLPYFALSTTSPLLQSWLARERGATFPYRLFALSNAASLAALLLYPLAVEPLLPTRLQMLWWSGGYLGLVLLLALAAVGVVRHAPVPEAPLPGTETQRPWLWIALAACASTLWLAVTNYLGQLVAAMPFLWIAPMVAYLLSFILCFEADGWYRPHWFRWLMPAAWIAISSRMALEGSAGGLQWEIPVFCGALFVCCMFCHGELARSKPAPKEGLAFFYLMVASGGALGGLFVGLVAPNLFTTFLELPLGVTGSIFLAVYFLYGYHSPRRLLRLGLLTVAAFAVSTQYHGDNRITRSRSFYGALQIMDSGSGISAVRKLYSGRTIHGLEFLSPALRRTPTTYYGVHSGVGRVLGAPHKTARRIAIVGLGAGTLATYGRSGDFLRFYEINPAVIRTAAESFHFLRDSAAATDVIPGDGRLTLAREPAHSFDFVVLDAFSDDAIPVHLLTREAFQMDFERLRPGGLLLVHLSNRYLDLGAEVEALAAALGKSVVLIHSTPDPLQGTEHADWAILSNTPAGLDLLRPYSQAPATRKVRTWTDEYSSLFQLWR